MLDYLVLVITVVALSYMSFHTVEEIVSKLKELFLH